MRGDWNTVEEASWIARSGKAARLVEKYAPNGETRVLDVGSGLGLFMPHLPRRFRIDGLDEYDYLGPDAKTRTDKFIRQNLNEAWNTDAERYDMVTAWNVLEHLENPFHFAREALHALKPNGVLLVSIPNIFNLRNRLCFLLTGDFFRYTDNQFHLTPFTHSTLRRIFAGFTLHTRGYIGFELPLFANRFLRRFLKKYFRGRRWSGQTLYMVMRKGR